MARGLSIEKTADALGLLEKQYSEPECEISSVSPEVAEKLEEFYQVPAEYFMIPSSALIRERISLLKEHQSLLNESNYQKLPPEAHVMMAKKELNAIISVQETLILCMAQMESARENQALRALYESTRTARIVDMHKV